MLFVKNAINLMGNKILIFNLKMNEFHKQNTLTIDDFQIIEALKKAGGDIDKAIPFLTK